MNPKEYPIPEPLFSTSVEIEFSNGKHCVKVYCYKSTDISGFPYMQAKGTGKSKEEAYKNLRTDLINALESICSSIKALEGKLPDGFPIYQETKATKTNVTLSYKPKDIPDELHLDMTLHEFSNGKPFNLPDDNIMSFHNGRLWSSYDAMYLPVDPPQKGDLEFTFPYEGKDLKIIFVSDKV